MIELLKSLPGRHRPLAMIFGLAAVQLCALLAFSLLR